MSEASEAANAARNAQTDALVGRTIADKFRVESFVGRGAMGAVYKATQLTLKKKVAIKVMNPEKKDATYASRFKREAKAAARMEHPNLLRVIDFGEEPDGLLYIAMELLEGRDLLEVLREEFPFSLERIVSVLSQTLAALAVAHEQGVVHRDLKPENIMLLPSKDDEGNAMELVKVCDFGVAKIVRDATIDLALGDDGYPEPTRTNTHTGTLTAYGTLIGTPEYMSPEQARGEPADARSDLYSLGVILFLMMTGKLPFDAKSKIRLVLKHVEEEPPLPSELDSKVDMRLEAICMKALAKPPDQRYQTAREMRIDMRSVLDMSPSEHAKLLSVAPPRREKTEKKSTSSSIPPPPAVPVGHVSASPASSRPPRIELSPTTTIQDPTEAAEAIAEARKRLGTHPPATRSTPPPSPVAPVVAASDVATVPPVVSAPGKGAGAARAVIAVAVVLALVLAVYLATR